MSQHKLKEINGDSNISKKCNNGTSEDVEKGNDLNTRKALLTPLEFRVTQQRETERPFSNKYNKHWEAGTYHCVVCDAELFQSETKFESKSGWPAFYNVVDPKRVKLTADLSHIGANLLLLVAKPDLARTEVSCASCNAHLGHLFKDGPKPTGLRYCINSSSLNFKSDDGESIIYPISPSSVPNGNGNGTIGVSIREYACNPQNTCSRPASTANTPVSVCSSPIKDSCSKAPNREFASKTPREQFFSSVENGCNSLPPMGALCLNTQSCQRIIIPKKPTTEDDKKPRPSVISNGAENNVNSGKMFSSSTSNGTGKTPASNIVTTPVSSKSNKYPFSKGTSLTAARINFFQKISAKQDTPSPSKWAATYNSKWSSNKSSSPLSSNNTLENYNSDAVSANAVSINQSSRFPSSCSSSSLCTVMQQPKMENSSVGQPRRSNSSFFSNPPSSLPSPTVSVEPISTPPRSVALRETTL